MTDLTQTPTADIVILEAGDDAAATAAPAGPRRTGPIELFGQMPIGKKLATLWLLFVVFGAIYAKIDEAVFGGALPLQDPNLQTNGFDSSTGIFRDGEPNEPISGAHVLGTDVLARDTFARILHGGWVSLSVSITSALIGVGIGGLLGSLVGFVRGRLETFTMAAIDTILAFPALVLLLAVISMFEVRSLLLICLLIGFLSIPTYTRVARATSLAVSNREFVLAARAIGTKPRTILLREILPNVIPILLAYALVAAAVVIVVEGALAFLGLSIPPPTSSWGTMINEARRDIKENFFQVLVPSMAMILTVLSLNQVGDWLQRRAAHRTSSL